MEKEELRRIGFYRDKVEVAGSKINVLSDAERFDLHKLLNKWLAEVEKEPISLRVPSSWGDVKKLYKAR